MEEDELTAVTEVTVVVVVLTDESALGEAEGEDSVAVVVCTR